ncbi:MAG: hypothetical protein IK062_01860 [Selenomonadaceae bacterium]|nr:hypothetical protein [Selenomonadaceae bacterium]
MDDNNKTGKKTAGNKKNDDSAGHWVRVKQYINRWGQLMEAAKYGYDHWTFFIPCRG